MRLTTKLLGAVAALALTVSVANAQVVVSSKIDTEGGLQSAAHAFGLRPQRDGDSATAPGARRTRLSDAVPYWLAPAVCLHAQRAGWRHRHQRRIGAGGNQRRGFELRLRRRTTYFGCRRFLLAVMGHANPVIMISPCRWPIERRAHGPLAGRGGHVIQFRSRCSLPTLSYSCRFAAVTCSVAGCCFNLT